MTFTGGTSLVLGILEILLIDTGFRKNSLGEVSSIHFFSWGIVVGVIIGRAPESQKRL